MKKEKVDKITKFKRELWDKPHFNKTDIAELGRKIGFEQGKSEQKKKILKIIDEEIRGIQRTRKDFPNGVNHNFWIAHIKELEKLKQRISQLEGEK